MLHKHRLFTFSISAVILLALSCACKPSPTGKLILQRLGTNSDGESISARLYELQGGWGEPREMSDPPFYQSAITGQIIAVSADQRFIVFGPYFMLDTKDGTTAPIPSTAETSNDYRIGAAAFSPDGRYLAYTVYPNDSANPNSLLIVMDLTSNTVRQMYKSSCADYQSAGLQCAHLGDPSWVDSNTLIFSHRKGLSSSYQPGSEDDPNTPNHLTVMTSQSEVILSVNSPTHHDYRAIGDVVFGYYNDEWVDAWLDGTDLKNGVYQPYSLCGSTDFCSRRGRLETASQDGRFVLSSDDSQWRIIEVRTGRATDTGTRYESECGWITKCLWSPDDTQIACLRWDNCNNQQKLFLIPLSKEKGGARYTEQGVNWELLDWRP